MNIKYSICALAVCGVAALGASADEAEEAAKGETEETPVVSAEFGAQFDSRYMTYGVVDGKDPILTPGAKLTLMDFAYFGFESIFDLTKGNGKRGGYGNRAGKYTTLDASVGFAHEFDLGGDAGTLGVDFNYIYEYIRRHRYHNSSGSDKDMGDTQYLNLELTLGGHWLEPTLAIERDLMADDGTYVNFELAHGFELTDTLTFTPSIAQGLGNTQRTRGYFAETSGGFSHGGLMDTTIKGEFEWAVCEHVSLTAYLAYSDYWFDSNMRDAARAYNAEWGKGCDHSWNFYGGIGVTVSF
jgi:hypothetical protein